MFKKLLVPLDGSPIAEQAIVDAAAIARASHASVDMVLVHEPPMTGILGDAHWDEACLVAETRYLDAIARNLAIHEGIRVTHTVLAGDPASAICERVDNVGAELVVMVTHGRTGFRRSLLGSVADAVLHRATVPILLLRAHEEKKKQRGANDLFRRVLVPLDGSAAAFAIVGTASELARCYGAQLVLLQVVQNVGLPAMDMGGLLTTAGLAIDTNATARLRAEARQQLDEVARTMAEASRNSVEATVMSAPSAAHAIIEFARTNDITAIAMTTRGRGASRLVLGSVVDKVLRGSNVPMLLRRPAVNGGVLLDEVSVLEQLPALSNCVVSG